MTTKIRTISDSLWYNKENTPYMIFELIRKHCLFENIYFALSLNLPYFFMLSIFQCECLCIHVCIYNIASLHYHFII